MTESTSIPFTEEAFTSFFIPAILTFSATRVLSTISAEIFLTSFPKSLLDLLERESSASLSAYLSSSSADKASSLNTIFSLPSKPSISPRIFLKASLTLSEEADLL